MIGLATSILGSTGLLGNSNGGLLGSAKSAIGGIGNILGIGGHSEKGSGMTKPNTVAWAIDKFDKANDYEALKIAPVLQKKMNAGASEKVLASYMGRSLGYTSVQRILTSSKWDRTYSYLKRDKQSSSIFGSGSSSSIEDKTKKSGLGKLGLTLGAGWLVKSLID